MVLPKTQSQGRPPCRYEYGDVYEKISWFNLFDEFPACGWCSDPVRINACKAENWQAIGERDGLEGFNARFKDRKDFCRKYRAGANASAASDYQSDWEKGDYPFWFKLGEAAGFIGKTPVLPAPPLQAKDNMAPAN